MAPTGACWTRMTDNLPASLAGRAATRGDDSGRSGIDAAQRELLILCITKADAQRRKLLD